MKPFLSQMINLSHIKRYSVIPCIHRESIAEHSFFVASIVMKLYEKYDFRVGHATCMAIMHDWTESYTDDITICTKRMFPDIAKAVENAEHYIAKNEFSPEMYKLWSEYKDGKTVEAKIVKLADTLQVLQYAENECKLGNDGYMASVIKDAESRANMLESELNEFKRR